MPKLLYPETDVKSLMDQVVAARQEVVTIGVEMVTAGWELQLHSHAKAQLLLTLTGVATCEAEGGIWLVPPQSALFIPAGVMHQVAVAGKIEGYAVFISPTVSRSLPAHCNTLSVSPLLRELIARSASFSIDYEEGGTESRVADLLMDEISIASVGGLHLPMPADSRLRTLFESLMTNPADRGTIAFWAKQVGMSERTLARVIAAETGMSFGRWRQQLNVILALQWMASGITLQQIADNLGYENSGSFVTMFRKAVGTSPARYMAERSRSST